MSELYKGEGDSAVMAVPWWIVPLMITIGSAVGVLLRDAVIAVFSHSGYPRTMLLVATSSILGGLLGAAMGAVMSTSIVPSEHRGPIVLGLIAAVGTFGASAILALLPFARDVADNFLWIGAAHTALTIFAAVVGFVVVRLLIRSLRVTDSRIP
jgi:fluoride ion exporter CrcB/FEX